MQMVPAGKTIYAETAIQRQACPEGGRIHATDPQIDQFVYELYRLTDDEIRIVEQATA